MKLFIYIILLNLIAFTAQSQQKYLRFVENKKFEKLNDLVSESLEKNQRDLDANVGATLLYFKNNSPFFDIKKAFFYNEFSRELFQEILDTKRIEKLNELKINLDFFDVLKDSIYYKSYNQVIIDPNVEALNDYLNYFKALPQAYKNDVVRLRNKLAYEMALSKNTVSSFQEFIDTYPKAIQVQESIKRRDIIAFDLVMNRSIDLLKNTRDISLIQGFLSKYPNSELRFAAIEIRDRWAFDQAVTLNTVVGFQDFLNNYPNSKLAAQVIGLRDNRAYDQALASNTVAGYQYFLTSYPYSKFVIKVTDLRDSLAFENNSNDILGLKNYIKSYPNSKRLNEAKNKLYALAWEITKKENSIESYESFKSAYPNSLFVLLANEAISKLKYDKLIKTFSKPDAIEFLSSNSANTMTFAVVDTLIKHAFEAGDIQFLDDCIENTSGEIQNRLLAANYYWMTLDGELITLNKYFEGNNEKNKLAQNDSDDEDTKLPEKNLKQVDSYVPPKERDFEVARMGDALNLNSGFQSSMLNQYENYIRSAKGKERSFVAVQKIIKDDLNQKKWTSAIAKIDRYTQLILSEGNFLDSLSPTIMKLKDLKDILAKPFDVTIIPKNWGEPVNSLKGGEYFPSLTADDKTLYFVGRNRMNSLSNGIESYEDIFVTKKIGNKWTNPRVMSELSNAYSNEGVTHVSSDATKLILFINGSLVTSTKKVGGWKSPEVIAGSINSGDWQDDATITSDNKAILFASSRPTNYNFALNEIGIRGQRELSYHGESGESVDIYVSLIDSNGVWGDAINLGSGINTVFNDRTPFLHPDMKTLYFSSSGHGGLGSEDVFKSTRLSDTCWTCWSKPVNLGKEINSTSSDEGFKINTGGNFAVYSKAPNGEYDLYSIKLPLSMRPDFVATINGKLTDSQNKIVNAQIKWEDLELNKTIGVSNVDPETGEYFIILPMGKLYGYYVDKMGYFPIANNLDLRKYNKAINIENNIKMVTLEEMKINGVSVIANNIFFETNKSELLPYSIPELERVAKILKSTDRKIEISGHTDDVGGVATNLILSNQRAESVVKYLIRLGCDSSKINSKGYGKSTPIGDNKTEVGRAANRRVEVKFITL